MSRVMVYVDGFNLYFGLRSKGWRKHYWLNLHALATALLKPGQTLQGVHYFTSRIRANGRNLPDMQRQTTYLEALGTLPALQTHFGHYLEKPKQCRQCGAQWMDYEEKMTDVNIAVQILSDAFDDRFDTALLISGDSDLTTPVNKLRTQFPAKRLIVAFPPGRQSFELKKAANATFTIGEANLRQSQLPAQVQRADGFMLQRPAHWK
ncbi:MAG: NYN domain-containing protein [Gammaproteobacteria bacterium]|nr:NYN domain-containing protein [Gammaproteobacteria bacterium]